MKNYITLFFICAIGVSCTKNDDENYREPTPTKSGNFLQDLHVGDKLYYSMLVGENYFEQGEDQFNYTGDTLELEVLELSALGAVISQRITAGSQMRSNPDFYYWQRDSVYTNTWNIVDDSLFVESDALYSATHLLGTTRLKFSDYSEQNVQLTGWRTTYGYSESNAQLFTTNYTLFDQYYDSLSVYIHNQPMSYDANGTTTVFSKAHGIVRSSEYGWWTQSGYGWDRIW